MQQSEHRRLFSRQVSSSVHEHRGRLVAQDIEGRAVEVVLEHRGMHIAAATDRPGVAELLRDRLDGARDVLLARRGRVDDVQFLQGGSGQHRAGPGAEVLGGELGAGDLAQVRVDVLGRDALAGAVGVEVLEQHLAGQVLAALDGAGEATVLQGDLLPDAALGAEPEPEPVGGDRDVAIAQRRQAERLVGAGVFLVADPDQRGLEQPDDGGQHPRPRQRRRLQIAHHATTKDRQRAPEGEESAVLGRVTHLRPSRVIAILLASALVAAGGLHVAVGALADPDARPGRRDHQRADARERRGVADDAALRIAIDRPLATDLSRDARLVVRDVAQVDEFGRVLPGGLLRGGARHHAIGEFRCGGGGSHRARCIARNALRQRRACTGAVAERA